MGEAYSDDDIQERLRRLIRAGRRSLLPNEEVRGFERLLEELHADLAPRTAAEQRVVGRIANAFWRLDRAEGLESELVVQHKRQAGLAAHVAEDPSRLRGFEIVNRYRATAMQELYRGLHLLQMMRRCLLNPQEEADSAKSTG